MIIVKIMGGLGNQLFQYAFGRMLSNHLNTELLFDLNDYSRENKDENSRELGLIQFNVRLNVASDDILKQFETPAIPRFINRFFYPPYLVHRIDRLLNGNNIVIEKNFGNFDNFYKNLKPQNYYLYGYWQSEQYSSEISTILLDEFKIIRNLDESYRLYFNLINTTNSVSIHIRRGDYVGNTSVINLAQDHVNYYYRAIDFIKDNLKTKITLFIFSDDINWCKANLKVNEEIYYINSDNPNEVDELHLMSLCKHNIIANSTFSWWGAWLNQNREKIIVTPNNWFTSDSRNKNNIIPENWIRINL